MPQRKKRSGARQSKRKSAKPPEPRGRQAEDAEIDAMALRGPKSKWIEPSDAAAGDPPTHEELEGIDLLGRASVRGGAIEGVSEASAESGIDKPTEASPAEDEPRENPPLVTDIDEDGGISESGGVAGGARGHGGTSDRGAGTPRGYEEAGPGEQKSTSRFDLDHGTLDLPEE